MAKDLTTQTTISSATSTVSSTSLGSPIGKMPPVSIAPENDAGGSEAVVTTPATPKFTTTTATSSTTTARKRTRTANSGPAAVTIVNARHNKAATIHTRPSKRPRNSYNQTYLYLDPSQNYLHGPAKGLLRPAYRDANANFALAHFLAQWVTDRILGTDVKPRSRRQVERRAVNRFEGILSKFNFPTTAVFLALHYVERAVEAGLSVESGWRLNLSLSRGPTVEQLVIYVTWIFLVALLAAVNAISSDKVGWEAWVQEMHLEAHHIRMMHRQFTMILDEQLTMTAETWTEFVYSLISFNDAPENDKTESLDYPTIVSDLLLDEIRDTPYSSTSQSRFIIELEDDEGRSPEDIQHLATVLAILMTHTINVTFESNGVPCEVAAERSKAAEKIAVARTKEARTEGDGERVFSPPSEATVPVVSKGENLVHLIFVLRAPVNLSRFPGTQGEQFSFHFREAKVNHRKAKLIIVPVDGTLKCVAVVA
ncbi:hypothetical protein V5O48_011637 [Marasmius crinis-equi]|uniref:Uncharacterized protein n=1 Tax=Marasmius crinis-equi TaxID=585013 RepID=A0ABR3F570_9AGAR